MSTGVVWVIGIVVVWIVSSIIFALFAWPKIAQRIDDVNGLDKDPE